MPRATPSVILKSVVLGVVVSAVLAGCSPAIPTGNAEESVPSPAMPSRTDAPFRMDPDEVRARIATSFPVEVPVVSGDVVRGRAQGTEAWDYELTVPAPAPTVAEWYFAEYQRRSWSLVEQPAPAPTDGSFQLTLRKGLAESQITITPMSENESRVNVILGVGTPVLETQ